VGAPRGEARARDEEREAEEERRGRWPGAAREEEGHERHERDGSPGGGAGLLSQAQVGGHARAERHGHPGHEVAPLEEERVAQPALEGAGDLRGPPRPPDDHGARHLPPPLPARIPAERA
jgi:hypothetical protein